MDAIIIGSNHWNTLGLIRSLGLNGVKPYLLLVNEHGETNYCAKSKYLSGCTIVKEYEEALSFLRNKSNNTNNSPVLFPSSDGAEHMIDSHMDELKHYYTLPGINEQEGAVSYLMNKANQALWSEDLGIPSASTYLVDLANLGKGIMQVGGISPVIVKPAISHEGSKADIKKCNTDLELSAHLCYLRDKGYNQCLVQEFIDYDCQYVVHGAMLRNYTTIPYIILKNIREWPETGGTGCFRSFINDNRIKGIVEGLLKSIREYGYRGLFDIELFGRNEDILLNEVNFRSSGVGYSMMHTKVFYPYYYYLDAKGVNTIELTKKYNCHHFVMNELTDIYNVKHGTLSFFQWLRDVLKTKDFAFYNSKDMRPAVSYYWNWMKSITR